MPQILVIDDDDVVRQLIEDFLMENGFDVLSAPDTMVALQQIELHPQIALCIVDLMMPPHVPDGEAFAQSVRNRKDAIQIILITGHHGAATQLTEKGVRVLYKPVDMDVLMNEVHHLIYGSR